MEDEVTIDSLARMPDVQLAIHKAGRHLTTEMPTTFAFPPLTPASPPLPGDQTLIFFTRQGPIPAAPTTTETQTNAQTNATT
jgi:hypothetical protein